MRKVRSIAFLRDTSGTPAIEFAILAPVFLAMMIGTLYMCVLLFMTGSLQYAVEVAARCASVASTVCSDNSSTITYAQSKFYGASILTPTFASSTAACGHSVSASANYSFDFGLKKVTVPVTAAACFP